MNDPLERAKEAIRRKDPGELRTLLDEEAGLVAARDAVGEGLLSACQSYANFAGDDPDRWTSVACAEVLIDAGARLLERDVERAFTTGSIGMVELFAARGMVPDDLATAAATGRLARVEELASACDDELLLGRALCLACRHGRAECARALVARAMVLDGDLIPADWDLAATVEFLMAGRSALETSERLDAGRLLRRSRITHAVEARDVARFEALLEEEPTLLSREGEHFQVALLEVCAYSCNHVIASALLAAGASVQHEPRPASPATDYAIDHGCERMIELLRGLWPPKEDLATCAGLGQLDALRAFFDENGALLPLPATETRTVNELLLHALGLALMNEKLETAAFLLDHGADVDGPWGNHEPASVLHETAGAGKLKSVRFLVERGADVTIRDERFGGFAFEWAQFMGQPETLEFLRPLTVARDLFAAVSEGDATQIQRHLDGGADPDRTVHFTEVQDVTPLLVAVSRSRLDAVERLLAAGANARHSDSVGRTALHRIQDTNDAPLIVDALLAAGADPTATSPAGLSAIDEARRRGLDAVVHALNRAAGADPVG